MLELETQALLTYEKLTRLQNSINGTNTLKTQNGFIQAAKKIKEILRIPKQNENLLSSNNPLDTINVQYRLNSNKSFIKNDIPPYEA